MKLIYISFLVMFATFGCVTISQQETDSDFTEIINEQTINYKCTYSTSFNSSISKQFTVRRNGEEILVSMNTPLKDLANCVLIKKNVVKKNTKIFCVFYSKPKLRYYFNIDNAMIDLPYQYFVYQYIHDDGIIMIGESQPFNGAVFQVSTIQYDNMEYKERENQKFLIEYFIDNDGNIKGYVYNSKGEKTLFIFPIK